MGPRTPAAPRRPGPAPSEATCVPPPPTPPARTPAPVHPGPGVRGLLATFCLLTAAGFVALVLLAHSTDRTFAWTIQPAATAAFLGSGYGAGFVLSVLCLRSHDWRAVRVPYLTVLVFTWLTTLATFVHLDRMHVVTPGTGPFAVPGRVGVARRLRRHPGRHGGAAAAPAPRRSTAPCPGSPRHRAG